MSDNKLRDRCAESVATGFAADVGVLLSLAGPLTAPIVSQGFRAAYKTVANDVLEKIPVCFTEGLNWLTGYVGFDHNTEQLLIESISDSSAGGGSVVFADGVTVMVTRLADMGPGRQLPLTTGRISVGGVAEYEYPLADWSTNVRVQIDSASTSDSSVPIIQFKLDGAYRTYGYYGKAAFLTANVAVDTDTPYTHGIQIGNAVDHSDYKYYSGHIDVYHVEGFAWAYTGQVSTQYSEMYIIEGKISLSSKPEGIRFTTNTTAPLDVGSIIITES